VRNVAWDTGPTVRAGKRELVLLMVPVVLVEEALGTHSAAGVRG
jgi:hypothetical protein